jgi:nitrate/nitrite-specific signal transduction histidine kinase
MDEAIGQTPSLNPALFEKHKSLKVKLAGLREKLNGDRIRSSMNESRSPAIAGKIWNVVYNHWRTTQLPTSTQKNSLASGEQGLNDFVKEYETYANELKAFETELEKAGAPYTPGRKL